MTVFSATVNEESAAAEVPERGGMWTLAGW